MTFRRPRMARGSQKLQEISVNQGTRGLRDSRTLNPNHAVVLCTNYSVERFIGARENDPWRFAIVSKTGAIDHPGTDADCGLFVDQSDGSAWDDGIALPRNRDIYRVAREQASSLFSRDLCILQKSRLISPRVNASFVGSSRALKEKEGRGHKLSILRVILKRMSRCNLKLAPIRWIRFSLKIIPS